MIKLHNYDNLALLKKLESNSIDCIYCDILFNTKNSFKDYADNLGSPQQAMEWYRPRFIQMRKTLKSNGLIYIHCDYNLSHYIKILMDEIFGFENFRNEIIWYFNSAHRKKKDFGKRHNVIFRYSKTKDYYFNAESQYIRQEYSKTAPRGYEKEKYYNPLGKILDDVWKIPILGQNDKKERTGYSTQKPKALLYPIIDSSCPKDGTFADFFCGSGTSLLVANELGVKNIIGCDISQEAIKITTERIGGKAIIKLITKP